MKRFISIITVAICVNLVAKPSLAVCIPAEPATSGETQVWTRIFVQLDDPQPYALVQCGIAGETSSAYWIPTSLGAVDATTSVIDSTLEAIWEASAPRVIDRRDHEAVRQRRTEGLEAQVSASLSQPTGSTLSAQMRFVEADLDGSVRVPEATAGLIVLDEIETHSDELAWLPAIRIPLFFDYLGPSLPVLMPSGYRDGDVVFETTTTVFILSDDHLYGLSDPDFWSNALPMFLDYERTDESPDPVIGLLDIRVPYYTDSGDFDAFYQRREAELDSDSASLVVQYAGPQAAIVEGTDGWLIRASLTEPSTTAMRFSQLPPTFFRASWVHLGDVETLQPSELNLGDGSSAFTAGAEAPAELTMTLVRRTLDENSEVVLSCDPMLPVQTNAEFIVMVEPGGTVPMVLVQTDDTNVATCLIDGLRHILFPLATGPPIAIHVPIAYWAVEN